MSFYLLDSFDCFIVYRDNGKCITTSVTHLNLQLILLQRHKWWFCCHFRQQQQLSHTLKQVEDILYLNVKVNPSLSLFAKMCFHCLNCFSLQNECLKNKYMSYKHFLTFGVKFVITFIFIKTTFLFAGRQIPSKEKIWD